MDIVSPDELKKKNNGKDEPIYQVQWSDTPFKSRNINSDPKSSKDEINRRHAAKFFRSFDDGFAQDKGYDDELQDYA